MAPHVAVVGTRHPTPYGEAVARALAADLARAGVVVVSGLALGIDAAAHRGALDGGGRTVAVVGTGVDVVYPRAHTRLAEEIVRSGGALVSQFPDGMPARRAHFPMRNRTMALISQAVVVVEAGATSGALITAGQGLELGREVMAVPGSVFSPLSVGCHQLLRDGAGLVQNARDVLVALGRDLEVLDDPLTTDIDLGVEAPAHADGILRHLSEVLPIRPAELGEKLGLSFAACLTRLTALELLGRVRRQGDGYVRVPRSRGTRL